MGLDDEVLGIAMLVAVRVELVAIDHIYAACRNDHIEIQIHGDERLTVELRWSSDVDVNVYGSTVEKDRIPPLVSGEVHQRIEVKLDHRVVVGSHFCASSNSRPRAIDVDHDAVEGHASMESPRLSDKPSTEIVRLAVLGVQHSRKLTVGVRRQPSTGH